MKEESQSLKDLATMYNSSGWKHLESWLNLKIDDLVKAVMDPDTPKEMVDNLRVVAYTYQSVLDKAKGDLASLEQIEKANDKKDEHTEGE